MVIKRTKGSSYAISFELASGVIKET